MTSDGPQTHVSAREISAFRALRYRRGVSPNHPSHEVNRAAWPAENPGFKKPDHLVDMYEYEGLVPIGSARPLERGDHRGGRGPDQYSDR